MMGAPGPFPRSSGLKPAGRSSPRSSRAVSGASTRCSTRSGSAVIDEPTWTALDPTRGTLRDIDTPQDLPSDGP